MSMVACIEPRTNGSYDEGNILRYYPWRVGADGIEIKSGEGGETGGWVDAESPIVNVEDPNQDDVTFFRYLFVEVEDSVGDDLQEYMGRRRGRFNWKAKFTDPAFRTRVRDISKHIPVQMGKGIKKSDIVKGPDWGKPRGKPE